MARPLRIELSGGLYHVTSRGDRREDIYLCEADREAWLEVFRNACERFNWVCHAFCQMTNHYHIVVETPEGNLSKGMRHLNGVYTQFINRTHGRSGHVFQGRFKGILVEKDSYLLELVRYVVLNPVRAGMVSDAKEWHWSSHRALLGTMSKPAWLATDWVLGQFGNHRSEAIRRYEDFVRAGVGLSSIWDGLTGQIFLGSKNFADEMRKICADEDRLREIPRAQRRPSAKPLADYTSHGRKGMAMAYLSGDYTIQTIADHFRVHYSTISRAIKQFEIERLNNTAVTNVNPPTAKK